MHTSSAVRVRPSPRSSSSACRATTRSGGGRPRVASRRPSGRGEKVGRAEVRETEVDVVAARRASIVGSHIVKADTGIPRGVPGIVHGALELTVAVNRDRTPVDRRRDRVTVFDAATYELVRG